MSHTFALRRPIQEPSVRLGPAALEAAFRAFVESLGGHRHRRTVPCEVIPAKRCDPTRAEIISAAYLGAPVALNPLHALEGAPAASEAGKPQGQLR